MTKQIQRVFIPYNGCCPFARDKRCNQNCVFFTNFTNTKCQCGFPGATNRDTGYFTELETQTQPYEIKD